MSASLLPPPGSLVEALEAEQAEDDSSTKRRRVLARPGPSNDRVLTYAEFKDYRDARDNPNKQKLAEWVAEQAKLALTRRPPLRGGR
jgi:hypothetical protein